jgi:2-dehydro-3-deoxyphosphogluconate aldolase / (4S)-4-hydroxy-2-oxoglutarate aldolase
VDIFNQILTNRIIAIVRLENYNAAVEVAQALLAGGITAVEFTLTGSGAHEAIAACRATFAEHMQIGVGTVLEERAARAAIKAGAQFVVTPTIRPEVIIECRAAGVPIACGAFTPSEALQAHELGADMIKIFPARGLGPNYMRDLLAPLPFLKLVPTGGIGPENARSYLDAGAVAVGIGGNLVSAAAVAAHDWQAITTMAQRCVQAITTS